jgi:hypothetical protein
MVLITLFPFLMLYSRLPRVTRPSIAEPAELSGHAVPVAGCQPDQQRGRHDQGGFTEAAQQRRLFRCQQVCLICVFESVGMFCLSLNILGFCLSLYLLCFYLSLYLLCFCLSLYLLCFCFCLYLPCFCFSLYILCFCLSLVCFCMVG